MGAPSINGVIETGVYVDDYDVGHQFYGKLLGLERMVEGERLSAYNVCPGQTLLLFKRGTCTDDVDSPFGVVPGHGAEGPSHFAFAIAKSALQDWREYLEDQQVPVRSEVRWPQGGISLYIDDPFGNVVELATPGLWPNYQD